MSKSREIAFFPLVQGIYFFITLIWPVVDIESFMWVTGWKVDIWLVKTVSVLLLPYAVICIWVAINQKYLSLLIIITMIITGFGLATVETYYYLNGTIRWVYFLDAVLQLVFIIWWIIQLKNFKRNNFPNPGINIPF